ncbi:hypothetical protein sos41_09050 [Alphaproteobacteria bacterium SO-S41]|nr:hypothetical protein sos41_09050 [Alphaproteobacteria bacterium SO-S41]
MIRRAIALAILMTAIGRDAAAVVILDSTYRREGYRAAEALAAEPQFAATFSFCGDIDDACGEASGTWIGNDRRHGYILTAAHNFDDGYGPDAYVYRTRDGTYYEAEEVYIHPDYQPGGENVEDGDDGSGYDLAIVVLGEPVTECGPAPMLYGGEEEGGETVTFVGYGTRGSGRNGEDDRIPAGEVAAAAQGVIEWVEPGSNEDGGRPEGNFFEIYLPREDGKIEDPFEGDVTRPVSKYAGLLGAGDSGGGAWLQTADGWVIAGVNDNGTGKAQYGDTSGFVRVSGEIAWIASIFPRVRVSSDAQAGN